jgi:hypothetical protein
MTFKEFLKFAEGSEKSGNPHPSPQRRILPGVNMSPAMPARAVPDHDPIQPQSKPVRAGNELYLIPKPKTTVGVIARPSQRK